MDVLMEKHYIVIACKKSSPSNFYCDTLEEAKQVSKRLSNEGWRRVEIAYGTPGRYESV